MQWYCKACPFQPPLCLTGIEDGSDSGITIACKQLFYLIIFHFMHLQLPPLCSVPTITLLSPASSTCAPCETPQYALHTSTCHEVSITKTVHLIPLPLPPPLLRRDDNIALLTSLILFLCVICATFCRAS